MEKPFLESTWTIKTTPTEFKPTNIPYVLLGAALLWFGWFGFNAGSALAANDLAVSALVTTNLAAAGAAVSWMLADWVIKGKPSAVGIAIGAVVGLVAITPAAGYVSVPSAMIIGLSAGVISNLVANWRAGRSRIDDTLRCICMPRSRWTLGFNRNRHLRISSNRRLQRPNLRQPGTARSAISSNRGGCAVCVLRLVCAAEAGERLLSAAS